MPRPRGCIPSPRHVLAKSTPHRTRANVPASFGVVPKQLSYWLNNQYGDCVAAEEAFAKAVWSVMTGRAELFVPDSEVQRWARAGGFLNGAMLSDVMAAMAKNGFQVGGQTYTDGLPNSVDFTDWANLTSALFTGPVKLGVDADDLENVVGQTNGWFGTGWRDTANQDHCTGLCGYGTVAECYQLLGMPMPANASAEASMQAVLFFTWNTIGVVDFASLKGITSEAWVRTPTTPEQPAPAPTPTPGPGPVPNTGVPPTAIWMDPVSETWHNGSGWPVVQNNVNEQFVIAEGAKKISVRKGLTQV